MEYTTLFLLFYFIFGIIFDFNSLACCLVVFFCCLFYDLRNVFTFCLFKFVGKIRRTYSPKQFLETQTYSTICLLCDVDFNLRQTEESLLQKCKLAYMRFFSDNSVYYEVSNLSAKIKLKQRYIQYIEPIKLFERYEILTKILYWEGQLLYVEQSIMRYSDNYRCAAVYNMFHISGATTIDLLQQLESSRVQPNLPIRTKMISYLLKLQEHSSSVITVNMNGRKP